MGSSMALPMFGFEGIVRVARLFLDDPSQLSSPMGMTFIDLLWGFNHQQGGLQIPLPLYWLKLLWRVEGAWFVGLAVAGWAYMATQLIKHQVPDMCRGFAVITLVYCFTALSTMGKGFHFEHYVAGLLPAAVLASSIVPGYLLMRTWQQSMASGFWGKTF